MIFGHMCRRLTSRAHFLHPHRRSVAIIINPPPPWSYYRVPHWISRTTRITLFSYIGIYVKLQENGILFLSGGWTRYNNNIAQQKYDNNSHSNCIFAQCVRLSKFTASTVRTYDKYLLWSPSTTTTDFSLLHLQSYFSIYLCTRLYRVKSTLKYTCFHRDRRRGYSVYKRVAGWLSCWLWSPAKSSARSALLERLTLTKVPADCLAVEKRSDSHHHHYFHRSSAAAEAAAG